MASSTVKRFAPLKAGSSSDAPKLRGIVFDMDGTLWYVFPSPHPSTPLATTSKQLEKKKEEKKKRE